MSEVEVLVDKANNGVALLTLNRPDVLNSLNLSMVSTIHEHLENWKSDDSVKIIIIKGAGNKAFCAGGDIKSIYEAKNNKEIRHLAEEFFEEEYELDKYIYNYPKPIIANLDGIVMGGGVGLTYGAKYRIVTEKTRWAMPEVNLGFFPDVGAGYFLNKMPGHIGTFLALTGEMISGVDVLYANAADYLISSSQIDECMNEFINESSYSEDSLNEQIEKKLESYKSGYCENELEQIESFINHHFKYESVEEIISSLKADKSEFAQKYYELLLKKSPVSLKVILKQLVDYKNKTIDESLEMDRILVSHFLDHNDFYEGVRSILVDKDRNPKYEYTTLGSVPNSFVKSFFV